MRNLIKIICLLSFLTFQTNAQMNNDLGTFQTSWQIGKNGILLKGLSGDSLFFRDAADTKYLKLFGDGSNLTGIVTNIVVRDSISETITGIDYDSTTGVFSITSGYVIPTTTEETNWNDAYSKRVNTWNAPITFSSNVVSLTQTGDILGTANQVSVANGTNVIAGTTNITLSLPQDIATTSAPTFAGITLNGNAVQSGNYSFYNNFTSGIFGTGWRLDYNVGIANQSNLEVDNLTVRNTFRTHIFQKDIARVSNGYFIFSDGGQITHIDTVNSRISFNDKVSATFSANDTLWIKDVNTGTGLAITSVKVKVNSIYSSAGDSTVYSVTTTQGFLSDLEVGMEAVRVSGGYLIADASSTYSPFLDIINSGSIMSRLGRLDGITDANFGALSGWGLYSQNAYLTGEIVSANIKTAPGTGQRIVLDATNGGQLNYYDSSNVNILKIGNSINGAADGIKITDGMLYAINSTTASPTIWAVNTASNSTNWSIYATVSGTSTNNYAVFGSATGGTAKNYGIYGTANGPGSYGGYFSGGLYVSGDADINNYVNLNTAGQIRWNSGEIVLARGGANILRLENSFYVADSIIVNGNLLSDISRNLNTGAIISGAITASGNITTKRNGTTEPLLEAYNSTNGGISISGGSPTTAGLFAVNNVDASGIYTRTLMIQQDKNYSDMQFIGAIRIGNAGSTAQGGMMKYTSGNFYGYNGSSWVSLDNSNISVRQIFSDEGAPTYTETSATYTRKLLFYYVSKSNDKYLKLNALLSTDNASHTAYMRVDINTIYSGIASTTSTTGTQKAITVDVSAISSGQLVKVEVYIKNDGGFYITTMQIPIIEITNN